MTWDEIIEEYIVCYEKLKQNNLLSLPMPLDNELPTKPFNISMGDITKLTTTDEKSKENSKLNPFFSFRKFEIYCLFLS